MPDPTSLVPRTRIAAPRPWPDRSWRWELRWRGARRGAKRCGRQRAAAISAIYLALPTWPVRGAWPSVVWASRSRARFAGEEIILSRPAANSAASRRFRPRPLHAPVSAHAFCVPGLAESSCARPFLISSNQERQAGAPNYIELMVGERRSPACTAPRGTAWRRRALAQ